jgi:hypothetical protein
MLRVRVAGKSVRRELAASRRRQRLAVTAVFLGVLCCLVVVGGFFAVTRFSSGGLGPQQSQRNDVSTGGNDSGVVRAVVVDALSLDGSNGSFVEEVMGVLEGEGFRVDVFSGTAVTVDSLKNLPGGCGVVLLRMHSAVAVNGEVYLFTGENYSGGKYVDERGFGLVRQCFPGEGNESVFGVNWGFVRRLMTGRFNGSAVVAMGCESGVDEALAEEFLGQGARAFVGWSGPVLLSHSDEAVLALTRCLCVEKLGVEAAVEKVNARLGGDPSSGAVLKCFVP